MSTANKILSVGKQGPAGAAGPSNTAAILAALAANPLTNAEKATMAAALGFPVYATLALANAGLAAIGRVFWNSSNHRYEVTSDIA